MARALCTEIYLSRPSFSYSMMNSTEIDRVAQEKYLYLTTVGRKTGRAHVVELWFAVADGRIYLSHEGKYTDWMQNIIQNSHVENRIRDIYLAGKAQIVTSGVMFEVGKKALYLKYYGLETKEVIDDWFSSSTIVEITPQTE